jgi:uncharacterized protein with HEPN domain
MSLSPRDREHLHDMLEWAGRAQRFVLDLSREEFRLDQRTQSAVLHALLIVGEAASRIDDSTRDALPLIAWHEIRGMRNRIAHDYLSVDLDQVWRTVSIDLPALTTALEAALSRL